MDRYIISHTSIHSVTSVAHNVHPGFASVPHHPIFVSSNSISTRQLCLQISMLYMYLHECIHPRRYYTVGVHTCTHVCKYLCVDYTGVHTLIHACILLKKAGILPTIQLYIHRISLISCYTFYSSNLMLIISILFLYSCNKSQPRQVNVR